MNADERIVAALQALADEDRGMGAPPEVEARVREAFRKQRARRRALGMWRAAIAASVAVAAAVVITVSIANRPVDVPPPPVIARAPKAPVLVKSERPVETARVVRPVAVTPKVEASLPEVREVATDFFPLVDNAPPFESGELRRVVVPASTLMQVGLPVRGDRLLEPVQADVLIGQEGIARAIRFVRYERQ